jgi:hypothetical protein
LIVSRFWARRAGFACCAFAVLLFSAIAHTETYPVPPAAIRQDEFPPPVEKIKISPPLDFCGEPVPLDHPEVAERLEAELLLMAWNRPQVILWLKRAGRYFPEIEAILKQEGLPEDLKYLAVIESGLRPHAGSSAGAIGFWQFIRPTALRYGLTVDSRKDQRRNLEASTMAAARYLKDLHAQFGSWHLASAAYNMGEQGLAAEMLTQEVQDYYRLYLYLETQRYVPRAVVAKLILSDPARFGFHLGADDLYAPQAAEMIRISLARETPLHLLARAAGTDFKTIKDLNPELRGHFLAAGNHEVRIPPGQAEGYAGRLDQFTAAFMARHEQRVYVVRPGDNLSTIAERFGVPLQALRIWNGIDLRKAIHPGDRLVVRPPESDLAEDRNDEN